MFALKELLELNQIPLPLFLFSLELQVIMSTTPKLRFTVEKPDGKPCECEAANPEYF